MLFDKKVTDINFSNSSVNSVMCGNEEFIADDYILATGHSARDIFHLLNDKGILIEAKQFALGVRVEHPQELIDKVQYSCNIRPEGLPPSTYSLVQQVE
ncbi:MAG: FAD-dependent protein, partial [Ferruginibacter sp.]